jgi:3-deoxy-D-manno-octulosonate 8-phosphate phosphatase (KDO 8-P phosphatase)
MNKIKLFITDVDGTLTNGLYHVSKTGDVSRSYFTRDFHGMHMLNKSGVKVCIMTMSRSEDIYFQKEKAARYATLFTGVTDKKATIDEIIGDDLEWKDIAYIGDDVVDEEILNAAGLAACPADADSAILKLVGERVDGFVSRFAGGHGAVRNFVEYILKVNNAIKN